MGARLGKRTSLSMVASEFRNGSAIHASRLYFIVLSCFPWLKLTRVNHACDEWPICYLHPRSAHWPAPFFPLSQLADSHSRIGTVRWKEKGKTEYK